MRDGSDDAVPGARLTDSESRPLGTAARRIQAPNGPGPAKSSAEGEICPAASVVGCDLEAAFAVHGAQPSGQLQGRPNPRFHLFGHVGVVEEELPRVLLALA